MSMPPTQPIAEWLAKIGLKRCAAAFAANDIDVSVLDHLTDTDSEKMRASLGYRRKSDPRLPPIHRTRLRVMLAAAPASRTWKVRLARCTGPNMNMQVGPVLEPCID
jgi:hypothetical protein